MKSTSILIKLIFLSLLAFSGGLLFAQDNNSGYIVVGNDSLFYESAGSGNTLVFIHDGVLPSDVWDGEFYNFAKEYRVIRYDRRGYGRSSPAKGDYTHLDDLEALFSRLNIDSACIIACSSGGALAIDFTLKNPEKVSSLVLVGAIVGGFSYTHFMNTRGGHMPPRFNSDLEENIYYVTDDPYLIYFKNSQAKQKALQLVKKYPQRVLNRPKFVPQPVPAYRRLNEIKIPTLILVGEFDIPDVHAHAGAINAGIANSRRMVVPEAGHLIPLEQPDIFYKIAIDFLHEIAQ